MNQEFVDLRQNHQSSESFWPSFTDIMMVIVMIFLLTSMVLMVKNWELLEQLRNSMAAEQQAEKVILDASQENATLEEQLAQAQNEVSMLRMRLMQASEQNNRLDTELDEKDKQMVIVLSENSQLKNTLHNSEKQISTLSSQVTALDDNLKKIYIDVEQTQKNLEKQRQRIIIITQQRDSKNRQLTALEDDFGSLKVKYDKLIKPARTAKGRIVVSLSYESINGKQRIRFKETEEENYTVVTEKELHGRLDKLKKQYPKQLYIKIVIPKESGLTYNEAWTFMKDILDKYDYYYQQ